MDDDTVIRTQDDFTPLQRLTSRVKSWLLKMLVPHATYILKVTDKGYFYASVPNGDLAALQDRLTVATYLTLKDD
jgi:hypothetical protein